PPAIQAAEEDLPIDCAVPKKGEVKKVLLLLRSGKAAGPDGIPAEALKADIDTATEILHKLFIKVWENEEIPKEWREGHLVKLQKKKEIFKNPQTTEELCFYQCQAEL